MQVMLHIRARVSRCDLKSFLVKLREMRETSIVDITESDRGDDEDWGG